MSGWTDPRLLVEIFIVSLNIVGWIFVWIRDKDRATNDALTKLAKETDERMDDLSERTARIEGASQNAPTRDQVGKMEVSITSVEGDLKSVSTAVKAMSDQMKDMGENIKMLVKHELTGGGRG
tara:strand:+ start:104 stop:472 length:369 start_codon:yes stop_codon:yes gene_type:complete